MATVGKERIECPWKLQQNTADSDQWAKKGIEEKERKGQKRKGKEKKGKERKGKEKKGKERKGKERKGKEHHRRKGQKKGRGYNKKEQVPPQGTNTWL